MGNDIIQQTHVSVVTGSLLKLQSSVESDNVTCPHTGWNRDPELPMTDVSEMNISDPVGAALGVGGVEPRTGRMGAWPGSLQPRPVAPTDQSHRGCWGVMDM